LNVNDEVYELSRRIELEFSGKKSIGIEETAGVVAFFFCRWESVVGESFEYIIK
jgi:hypothetical protein